MRLERVLIDAFVGRSGFVIRCPNDEQSLIAWQLWSPHSDWDLTFALVDFAREVSWTLDRVGYPNDARNVGMPLDGDDPHVRYRIWCPNCSYRKVLNQGTVAGVIQPLVEGRERQGGGMWVEDDIDGLLRRVARA
jgi:hypothetical protein